MATTTLQKTKGRTGTWALLGVLLFLCVAAVFFPLFVLQPFVRQAPMSLSLALLVERWAPWLTLLGFVAGLLFIVRLWRGKNRKHAVAKKACLLASAAVLVLCAWAARINVYERMFRPVGNARFVAATHAGLRPEDMVMAVSINGDDRAYPVLQMAYHHLLNDVVGGVAIVPTY
jgi:hypothetical protein